MQNQFADLQNLNGGTMQEIKDIITQINMIMHDGGISQTSVVNALDNKCSRVTILNLLKGDGDFKMSTLMMVLDVIGVTLRLETEKSREAIMAGDIAVYRTETEHLRTDLESVCSERDAALSRVVELQEQVKKLTGIADSQQHVINRYIERIDAYEQRNDRKDDRIEALEKRLGIW